MAKFCGTVMGKTKSEPVPVERELSFNVCKPVPPCDARINGDQVLILPSASVRVLVVMLAAI